MRLTVRREGAPARELRLPGPEVTLGKSEDCDVVLADSAVSRRHARLAVADGRVHLEDLGSTNGTSVGGAEITGRTVLAPGQEIAIGPFTITVAADEEPDAPTAPPAATPRTAPVPLPPALRPLEPLFADDAVSEIMVNGADEIFVERGGRLELTAIALDSADAVREAVELLAERAGRSLDRRRPYVDVRLSDGSRMNAILPPLALRGPCLTIRRFSSGGISAARLVELGAASPAMIAFLEACVRGKTNLLVSGGTSSGKTTLLNALCAFAGPDERIVTIEDAAELRLPQRHVIPLEMRPPEPDGSGGVSIRDLLRNSLRMRPDRIVVGEVRGAEALDMLTAMNTGHEGSLSTVHANSPREALAQLETFVRFAGAELPSKVIREQIVGAIRIVVQTSRAAEGRRRLVSIAEVSGMEGEQITMGEIFRFDPTGGAFRATGYVPRIRERLAERGVAADVAWFRV